MPLSDLIQPTTEDYLKRFQEANPTGSEDAFQAAKLSRQASDRSGAANRDLNLRDAEHALFSQSQIDQRPILGRLGALIGVPGYTAAKVLAQNYPATNPAVKAITGMDLSGSTKPDLRELYWGLKPVFASIKPRSPRDADPDQP